MRLATLLLIVLVVAAPLAAPSAASGATNEDREIALGRQGAAQIEARYPIVKDGPAVDRVNRIGMAIAAVTERPHLPWTFRVVSIDQVNAVALPGGFVYVTTGLLGFVRSDHELAAVLAHEATHAAHGHGLQMMQRANQASIAMILVAIFTRDPALIQGSTIVGSGMLAGYSREMEKEADLTGISYLSRTPYSPVGMLTLLERLARLEQMSPQPQGRAFADHPSAAERAQYVEAELRARRIPINRRAPANYLVLTVREGTDAGVAYGEILVNNRPIVRLADVPRIKEAADLLDRLFDTDLEPYELSARETPEGWGLFARGWAVLRLGPADAPQGSSVREFAVTILTRLRAAIDDDIRRRRLQG
jgi:Zn-dependent protease with chaperone function